MKGIKIIRRRNIKKREYGLEQYKNLSGTEKQRLVEYKKRYYEMRKK